MVDPEANAEARAGVNRFTPDGSDPRSTDGPILAIIALAVLACVTSLTNGFAYDDRWIIVDNANVHDIARWWEVFNDTYWPAIRGAALYRPFTILAYQLEWWAGGESPLLFHVINVALYAMVSALVYTVAIEVLPRSAAWVAAALFAVHPVHVEAVGNVVGQAELWSSAMVIAALGVFLRGRRGGVPLDRKAIIIILGFYFAGMMFKENAIVLPALLLIAELFIVADARPWSRRIDETVTLCLWLGLLASVFLAVRVLVTGEIGGDVEHPALRNLTMLQRSWVMLALAPEFARLLIWPANLYADYSPRHVPVHTSPHADHTSGALLLLCLVILALVSARRFPLVTFGLAWVAITVAPVANILLPTGILIAERTLFLPSVGVVLAGASLIPWFVDRLGESTHAVRIAAAGILAIVLMSGAAWSAERQRVWADSNTVFKALAADAPLSFKAHYANGGMMWEDHRPGEAEREWHMAIALFPEYFGVYQDLAHKYREAHICPAAIPLYKKALQIEPALPFSHVGLTACYLEIANFRTARSEARTSIADSAYRAAFEFMLCKADSALVFTDTIDATNRWMPRPARRLVVASLGLRPAQTGVGSANRARPQNARTAVQLGLKTLGPVTAKLCKSLLHSD